MALRERGGTGEEYDRDPGTDLVIDLDDHSGEPLVLIGLPSDANSSFLAGAAAAPGAIRAELFSPATSLWTERGIDLGAEGLLHDAGDLDLGSRGDDFGAIEDVVAGLLARGARVIAMGGDHAVTHPLVRAHRSAYPRLSILHFDAHPDLYADFDGNPRSHASPFARIMEEGLVERLVQVGIRATNPHLREQSRRYGVEVIDMRSFGRAYELAFDEPVFLSFDMDVLDPAYAPGVSHREPGGPSTREVLDVVQSLHADVVGADVVELNPARDPQGVTAATAARVLREIAGKMLERMHGA